MEQEAQIRGAAEFTSLGVPVFLTAGISVRARLRVSVFLHVPSSRCSAGLARSAAQMAVLALGVMVLVPEERCAAAPLGVI